MENNNEVKHIIFQLCLKFDENTFILIFLSKSIRFQVLRKKV